MRRILKEHYAAILAGAFGYWLVLFILTHIPTQELPTVDILGDKVCHLVGFAVLAGLWGLALRIRGRLTAVTTMVLGIGLGTYGALDEWSQRFVPGRSPDAYDWLADIIGIAVGLAWIHAASSLWPILVRWAAPLKADETSA